MIKLKSPLLQFNPALQYSLLGCVGVLAASLTVASFATGQTASKPAAKPAAAAAAAPAAAKPGAKTDAPAAQAAAPVAAEPEFQVTAQLRNAGVKTCLQTAQGMGAYTMNGVTEYAAASSWNAKTPDTRFVSALIGQKFGAGGGAPVGMSSVFSAPNPAGKCDGAGVQVIPTASACKDVQGQILQKGKALAELAGIPLLQDAANARIMLLPSAGNGCVIVGVNNFYAE